MAIKVRKKGDNDDEPDKKDESTPVADAAAADPFLNATTSTANWIERNRGLALGGLAAIIIVILGGFGVMEYLKSQDVQASSKLAPAFTAYETPIAGSPELDALSQAGINIDKKFDSPEQRWEQVNASADETLASTKKGPLAQSARLAKGAAGIRLEKWDESISAYEAYLAEAKGSEIEPFVHQGLATAYAGKGDVESARAQLAKLEEAGEDFAEIAKYQEAVIVDNAGNVDEAKDLYHGILEANPETPYKTQIERRLALL